jgi:hypothetical protein
MPSTKRNGMRTYFAGYFGDDTNLGTVALSALFPDSWLVIRYSSVLEC